VSYLLTRQAAPDGGFGGWGSPLTVEVTGRATGSRGGCPRERR
jgi:hypothetical protein